MAALNKDVLFDIAKTVVENGDQSKVYLFALSGQEPFQAMKEAFASVTSLELHDNYYVVGWDKGTCKFITDKEPHIKVFMNCIGNSVKKLSIHCSIGSFYASIMNKIFQAKKLTYLLCSKKEGNYQYFLKLIKACPGTLEELTAPTTYMKEAKSDTENLNLKTLTFLEKFCSSQLFSCCKTEKLILNDDLFMNALYRSKKVAKENKNLSSIMNVVFNVTILQGHLPIYDIEGIMPLFPSILHLTFDTTFIERDNPDELDVNEEIHEGLTLLQRLKVTADQALFGFDPLPIPPKLTYIFQKEYRPMVVDIIGIDHAYEYDNSVPDFYCYLQTIEWYDVFEDEVFLEVQIAK